MLADTEDDDEDDIDARNGVERVAATADGKKDQRAVRAELAGDADALAATYLSLDAAAKARFRTKCGLSVI